MHTAKAVLGIAGGRRSFEGGIDNGRRMICTQHCRFLDGLQGVLDGSELEQCVCRTS